MATAAVIAALLVPSAFLAYAVASDWLEGVADKIASAFEGWSL